MYLSTKLVEVRRFSSERARADATKRLMQLQEELEGQTAQLAKLDKGNVGRKDMALTREGECLSG